MRDRGSGIRDQGSGVGKQDHLSRHREQELVASANRSLRVPEELGVVDCEPDSTGEFLRHGNVPRRVPFSGSGPEQVQYAQRLASKSDWNAEVCDNAELLQDLGVSSAQKPCCPRQIIQLGMQLGLARAEDMVRSMLEAPIGDQFSAEPQRQYSSAFATENQ